MFSLIFFGCHREITLRKKFAYFVTQVYQGYCCQKHKIQIPNSFSLASNWSDTDQGNENAPIK